MNGLNQIRILRFIIRAQTITKDPMCNFDKIVKGTSGYIKAQFSFSSEWNGCKIAASFWSLGKEYAAILKNGECFIPEEALQWNNFGVSVTGIRGKYKIKTNQIRINQEE